jgi:hypothetical protein
MRGTRFVYLGYWNVAVAGCPPKWGVYPDDATLLEVRASRRQLGDLTLRSERSGGISAPGQVDEVWGPLDARG